MRTPWLAAPALAALVGSVIAAPGIITAAQDFSLRPQVQKGLKIAPVRLNLRGKNRSLVGLGSYIVNGQSSCLSCHTFPEFAPGGDPFQGQPEQINTTNYLAGGARFGPFVSTNLTPDTNGRPGGLTFEEFEARMRTGMTPNHPQFGPFLQVMPWPSYQGMTDRELKAIYEYLRAVPHADPVPPPAERQR
jgi:hypothetical protein